MSLEVLFVGVSTASPGPGEESACYIVKRRILIDTGWNAALSMQAHGVSPTDIDHIFFTHCHHDHILGLPGLFFANRGRPEARPDAPPLQLYGPIDLPLVRDGAVELLQGKRYPQCVPEHDMHLIHPGESLECEGLEIQVGRAFHPLDARCYRFTDTATGASVVFSGDTSYHEGLPLFAEKADVLIHEAAASPQGELPALHRYLHSRPQDAARVAAEAGVGVLALVHYAAAGGPQILARARETFPNVRLAQKGQRLQLLGPSQVVWV